ncbi:hypothetical protein [Pseudobacter ginsenosidimutans]|uniref:Uncharacterized protein n=1 Tax=Pseudobacter ginsenosidimutans TaxID=661488 RepID=A0A4Q7MND0_9BACT|nr:hypothetical protein [Pseudobacter ginsenosidimutans]QEC40318.1 hypothetical protein FSB84_00905 [Pseudobacter ginsenosidimutans]RZS69078.1 hypothetical protein EV199_4903 [Pseudobacter ginsenosidimutans]
MNSTFYRSYNICKNNQLDEFYNTAELVRFLNQMPELIQTNEHHFSNNKDFKHYLSITLLCAAQHDNWFYDSPESHATNLIVVVTSRLNNAHLFVKPLLLKICRFLNWDLMGDDDDAITPEDEINLSPPAPFRRLNDEEKEIYQADDAIDNEEDNDNDDDEEDDDHYTPPFRFHPN